MKQGDLFADPQGQEPEPRAEAQPQPEVQQEPEPEVQQDPRPTASAPPDDAARLRAVGEFRAPLLLEAGAGTGKTATLVARVVHWCAGQGWEAEQLARPEDPPEELALAVLRGVSAITFSEAAAAEMATRVDEALLRIEQSGLEDLPPGMRVELLPAGEELKARTRALRAALDHLNVSTIHAFCRRLLAAHPLAVGLDPAFEVDATFERTTLAVREEFEAYLQEAWSDPVDEDLVALAVRGVDLPTIEEALVQLVSDDGARAVDLEEDPFDEQACADLLEGLVQALDEVLEVGAKVPDAPRARIPAETMALLTETRGQLDSITGRDRAALQGAIELVRARWADGPTKKNSYWTRLGKWAQSDFVKGVAEVLGDQQERFSAAAAALRVAMGPFLRLDPEGLELARRVMHRLLARVEAGLRRRGVVTFTDLLVEARRLLVDHPDVAERERRKLSQLLVDEFQDTSATQCDIVGALALEGPAEERPGLFLVGDPKQSIFAWRSADLAAFDDFRKRVEAEGGEALQLTRNFRSGPEVLAEVDRAVDPVMKRKEGVQPEFVGLDSREDAPTAQVEYWVSWPRDEETGDFEVGARSAAGRSYRTEANAIAADIAGRGAPWKDHAIVLRASTGVDDYLDELRRRGVPYEVQSDRKYFRRREVVDAAALVRTVLDPLDPLALVTLLRAPSVGVPDAALLPLWEEGLPRRLAWLRDEDEEGLAALDQGVDAAAARIAGKVPGLDPEHDWPACLKATLRVIGRLRGDFHELPGDAWVEQLRRSMLLDASEAGRFLGAYRLANLDRFFRDLTRALQERSGDVASILRTLRANLAREDKSEVSNPASSNNDAVQVLTIHGAKGREFQHVYLAQAHRKGAPNREATIGFGRSEGRVAYVLFGLATPNWYARSARQAEAESAERVRLLYVALTRAKGRQVVLGSWPVVPKRKLVRNAQTFADLLEHRADIGDALVTLEQRGAADDPTPHIDRFGVTWRLAGFVEPVARDAEAGAEVSITPLEVVDGQVEKLGAHRARARKHAVRRFNGRASDGGHLEAAEETAASRFGEGPTGPGIGREAAMEVGTAVHEVLEHLDLTAPLEPQLADARDALTARLSGGAATRALELLQLGRPLIERLHALGDAVLARELPVLLPPGVGLEDPVGFTAGAIDLLYRDPRTDEVVVADFKTDHVTGEELQACAAGYAAQCAAYGRAVQEALGLESPPREELWFLHAGEVVPAGR